MKVCEYCGAEISDSVSVCPSCGGNEFKNKCGNCGSVFENGNFCPQCGVKAGAKAKKCPRCGAEYYSAACPDCGYTGRDNSFSTAYNPSAQPRKRRTWLWVLGWIFIFPVPITVLMIRNEKINKWAKIAVIAIAWILYVIALGSSEASESPETTQYQRIAESSEVQQGVWDEKGDEPQSEQPIGTVLVLSPR